MRALLLGYFSTVGDLEVLARVRKVLDQAGMDYDVAPFDSVVSDAMPGARSPWAVEPSDYTHLLVVCGPLDPHFLEAIDLDLRLFAHCTQIGVNLTMIHELERYDPLDVLLGRDSDRWSLPDLSFTVEVERQLVAGICLVDRQSEYGDRAQHDKAEQLLRDAAARAGLATIELDTEWPLANNRAGITSPEGFESVLSRLDLVLTTRLHGMVLSLKQGVPVIALDAIVGRAKVSRQAAAIGWEECYSIDDVTEEQLDEAIVRCLDPAVSARVDAAVARGRSAHADFDQQLLAALEVKPGTSRRHHHRPLAFGPRLARRRARVQKRFQQVLARFDRFLDSTRLVVGGVVVGAAGEAALSGSVGSSLV